MKFRIPTWLGHLLFGFAIGFCIMFALIAAGCDAGKGPMPEPGTKAVPAGTMVTIAQAQAAQQVEQKRLEAEQKAEEAKIKRELRGIERQAKTATDSALAKAQDKAEELAESAIISTSERSEKLAILSAGISQLEADIEARQSFVQGIAQLGAAGLQNSGLPGGGLAASLLVGVGGLLWGQKKSGDAKSERAASTAHDEAWEESKKEMLALITQMRGVGKE